MSGRPRRETLPDLLRLRRSETPDRRLYTFLEDGEREGTRLTFGELDARARAIAASLQARGLARRRALLVYPSGAEFVAALFGCFDAGVVAVPLAPPRRGQAPHRLGAIARESGATFALTRLGLVDEVGAHLAGLRTLVTDTTPASLASEWQPFYPREEDPALLHYAPRPAPAAGGVLVTHADLRRSCEAIRRAFRLSPRSVSVSWLPGAHDMGLIDGLLQPVFAGYSAVVMPPEAFLHQPARWLRAISKYRATHSGGPEFAFDYCLRKIPARDRSALDLSSWASVYNGAGTYRRDAFQRFAEAFHPHGFRPSVLRPCYGRALTLPTASNDDGDRDREDRIEARAGGAGYSLGGPHRLRPVSLGIPWRDDRSTSGGEEAVDLRAEAFLDPRFHVERGAVPPTSEARSLFLTGATGFLGAFLLRDLLENTGTSVHCLVRAGSPAAGMRRLEQALGELGAWDDRHARRITPVAGDVAQPLLGLSPREYYALAARTDAVYHAAGLVHWLYPYPALRGANVQGTREVLKFAASFKVKPLHYVSSLSVFDSPAYAGQSVDEDRAPEQCEEIHLGWSQSKWVAERLVTVARSRGLPASIYRLARLSGHSRTGAWVARDFHRRWIDGCIRLGAMPELDATLDLVPVDHAAGAIGALSRRPDARGATYHIHNPRPLTWAALRDRLDEAGYPVEAVPFAEWTRRLGDEGRSSNNPLYPFMPHFLRRWSAEELSLPEWGEDRHRPTIDGRRTAAVLRGLSLECPPLDDALLATYLARLVKDGLPLPASPRPHSHPRPLGPAPLSAHHIGRRPAPTP